MRPATVFAFLAALTGVVHAQSSNTDSNNSQSQSQSQSQSSSRNASISTYLTTSYIPTTVVSHSGDNAVTLTTSIPTTFSAVTTFTPTSTSSSTSSSTSATSSASATPTPITLDTKLDPAFGVLGGILIVTGLPSAFWGHKNRWTSFFITGFYTLSLVCIVLILNYGVLPAINPPSKSLRGAFVAASTVAGFAGGAITIFFWKSTRYFIGAWGGFAFALWIQCFRDGGLIRPIGFRWILYIGCATIGFVLCTIPKLHYHILLIATAITGASAFMLGVDCFTTAGLKEFYIWNIGFNSLFQKFTSKGIEFPVSQTIQIELGLLAAVALMGAAVQLRILKILQRKLKEIEQEQKKRDEEAELQVAEHFAGINAERDDWEREHGVPFSKHERSKSGSGLSAVPLMQSVDFPGTPTTSSPGLDEKRSYMTGTRSRYLSGDLLVGEDGIGRDGSPRPPSTVLNLDLGPGIGEEVPKAFISDDVGKSDKDEAGKQSRDELLQEIAAVRKSIEVLKAEATSISSGTRSRHPSLSSHLTLDPTHLRAPVASTSRSRAVSMELDTLLGGSSAAAQEPVKNRPKSTPINNVDWDAYVQERQLLQPPSGVTLPIPTTPPPAPSPTAERVRVSPAIAGALNARRQRESAHGRPSMHRRAESEDLLRTSASHHRSNSSAANAVTILPPRKQEIAAPVARHPPQPSRVHTFEELSERHREKMRNLQAPVTQAEQDSAQLVAAKARWERSMANEKRAVEKRQADKADQLAKETKKSGGDGHQRAHSRNRSLSASKLAAFDSPASGSSRRVSAMKVAEWQKMSTPERPEPRPQPQAAGGSHNRRDSRMGHGSGGAAGGFMFPANNARRDSAAARPPVS